LRPTTTVPRPAKRTGCRITGSPMTLAHEDRRRYLTMRSHWPTPPTVR
jgi:hypothetical protein